MLATDSETQYEKINALLQKHLDALHQEAEHNQSLFQLGKCAGLAGLILGGVGCVALPPVGVVVVGSAIATYFTSLLSETAITQDLTPIPWSQTRLSDLAAGLIQESNLKTEDLEFVDYLPKRDQVFYLLILTQGNRLARLLAQLPEPQWKPAIEGIIAQTIKVNGRMGYLDAVRDGEGILNVAEQNLNLRVALPSGAVGNNTRLNAVPVAASKAEEDPWEAPVPQPTATQEQTIAQYVDSTKPVRDIESAIEQAQKVDEGSAPITKPEILKMPLPQRADYLSSLLAEYGCDLRRLIGRPTLAAGGLQRSGKTTLIMLLGILEKAKGQKLFYISRDSDLYPVAFDGYANGSIKSAVSALGTLNETINSGSMGSLTGQTWVLDEFSSTAKEMDEKARSAFWGMALTGFAKQGGRVRFIVHHKTAKANGLPAGEAETFKAEVKMFWTDRTEMADGTYQPSGQYELLAEVGGFYKETGETFQIPEWLLTDTNPAWHNAPCPVRSLLSFFPELDTRKGAIATPLSTSKPKDPFAAKVRSPASPDDHEYEEVEGQEFYTLPNEPLECVELAAKIVRESGTVSVSELDKLVPGLAKYLPTVARYYSECSRRGEVYQWS